jgi:hypothetical protein
MTLTPEEIERKCRTATPGQLNVWLHDSRREVQRAAAREVKLRKKEMRERASLTGVVDPLDRT